MKRLYRIAFPFLFISLLFCSCQNNLKYPTGKDTIQAFGDGRFNIAYVGDEVMLCDSADPGPGAAIERDVKKFTESPIVYTIGEKGYTRVNVITGSIKQSKFLEEFDEDDQEIFRQLKQSESRLEK